MTTFFSGQVLPLMKAGQSRDQFAVTRLLRKFSPLLTQETLYAAADKQNQLALVRSALDKLLRLWDQGADPSLREVLSVLSRTRLLEIPEPLQAHASSPQRPQGTLEAEEDAEQESERDRAIEKFLGAPFSQIEPLTKYMSGQAHFDTHQGIKGLEFERVIVIMDDAEAKGFMFKYEDLFGGKAGNKSVDATKAIVLRNL